VIWFADGVLLGGLLALVVYLSTEEGQVMQTFAKFKKSIAAFLAAAVAAAGTLLSLGILGDAQSHGLTVAIAFLTPILVALGVAVAPKNAPPA
jgi:hypothetical protein